jgi:hypothetical protein
MPMTATQESQEPPHPPERLKELPRTYLISGGLGLVFFVASGLLWDGGSFAGSLFLELGGGAFIVFLLDFLLPTALTYADGATRGVRVTKLVWDPDAARSLAKYQDHGRAEELLASIELGGFPARPSSASGIYETSDRVDGSVVLSRQITKDSILTYYVPHRSWRGQKTVVIMSIMPLAPESLLNSQPPGVGDQMGTGAATTR